MSDREVQLGNIPPDDPSAQWYAVRNVFHRKGAYEDPDTYVSAFFDTGGERQGAIESG